MRKLNLAKHAVLIAALQQIGEDEIAMEVQAGYVWIAETENENALLIDATLDVSAIDIQGDFELDAAEMIYNREESMRLRSEVVRLRGNYLANNYFREAVILSHVIAWMIEMMKAVAVKEEDGGI